MKITGSTGQIPKSGLLLCAGAKGLEKYLFLFPLFFALTATAQEEVPHFDHISTKEGLSGEVITALCQDRRGFLWVGTNGQGLNRYDGNEVKVWRHSKRDSFSLCSDQVWSILEDANGLIWVGTQNGVSRLNPFNGRCDNYVNDGGGPIVTSYVFPDTQGFIWSASTFSLSRYNPGTNRFERYLALDVSNYFAR